jgi:pSer/pThr/pTyr-binding forkhead associated (FHA) protein
VRPAPAPPPPAPVSPPAPVAPPPPAPRVASRAAEDVLTPDGTAITAARPLPSRTPTAPTAPAFASPDTAPPDTAPAHSATIVLPRARLSLLDGNEPVKEFPLRPGVSVIGRLAQSDIQLPSPDVSRRHAQVTVGPDGCFVADLGSENGVAVNGHLVENRRLEDGDIIVLGKQRLVFHT